MSDAIPKLKSAAFDANDTLVVHLNNGKSFDFKKVMWFTVGQRFQVEWCGSGPSGPWGVSVTDDFSGIQMPDGTILRDGTHQTGRTDGSIYIRLT